MNAWKTAEALHSAAGLDYASQLEHYQENGFIYASPYSLIWAEAISDSWMVYLAIGEGAIPEFIGAMPFWLPRVTYCRLFRNKHSLKSILTERLCRYYEINYQVLKSRKIHS